MVKVWPLRELIEFNLLYILLFIINQYKFLKLEIDLIKYFLNNILSNFLC